MEIRDKNFYRKKVIAVSVASFLLMNQIGLAINNFIPKKTVKVPLSNTIRDYNKDFPEPNYELVKIKNNGICNSDTYDLSINEDNLSRYVKSLKIDASNLEDLDILKYTPNIETLRIENYELLTDEQFNIIENLNHLKKLDIIVNQKTITENPDYKIDLSNFKSLEKANISYLSLFSKTEEIDNVLLYKVIKGNKDIKIGISDLDNEDVDKIKKWDKSLEDLIASFHFSDNESDIEKISTLCLYVCDKIKYDQQVSDDISEYGANDLPEDSLNKVLEYNEKLLSTILSSKENEEVDGVCCNYATLLHILSNYSGISLKYETGIYETPNELAGHAWNTYEEDGENYIIDPTKIDNNQIIRNVLEVLYNNMSEESITDIKRLIFDKEEYATWYKPSSHNDYIKEQKYDDNRMDYINYNEFTFRNYKGLKANGYNILFLTTLVYLLSKLKKKDTLNISKIRK